MTAQYNVPARSIQTRAQLGVWPSDLTSSNGRGEFRIGHSGSLNPEKKEPTFATRCVASSELNIAAASTEALNLQPKHHPARENPFQHLSIPSEALRTVASITTSDGFILPLYELAGKHNGPAVLFMHGCAFAAGSYLRLLRSLAGHARVFAFDARGHGGAIGPVGNASAFTSAAFEADLIAVAEAVIAKTNHRLNLVGHSFGGATALRLAAHRPRYVHSLTVIEPSVLPGVGRAKRVLALKHVAEWASRANARRKSWTSREQFAHALGVRLPFSCIDLDDRLAHARAVLQGTSRADFEMCCVGSTEAAVLNAIATDDLWVAIDSIVHRVNIISADPRREDRLWMTDSLQPLAEWLGAAFHVVPNANHLLPLTRPESIVAVVLEASRGATILR